MSAAARIPATIVTGFLGAGKTTLIRSLIAQARGRRLAIVVNEFGDMGFDGALIADCDDDCRPDRIVELTNGCICCTVADEFLPTIEALLARDPAPDHIVIETSGLALPQPLVRAFSWPSVKHRVTVDGVVTVVDAEAVAAGRFAPNPEATRAQLAADAAVDHDDPIEELFEDQLRCADLVLLAKTDLVSAGDLARSEALIRRETRPGTGIVRSVGGNVPVEILLGIAASAEADMAGRESHHELEGAEHEHDDFDSFVMSISPARSLAMLESQVAAALAVPGVLRVKGRASIAGKAAMAIVQAVGPRLAISFAPGAAEAGLVVIGLRGMDRGAVAAALGS
jgi:cobalamin biosynthesis protein CobW